MEAKCLLVSFMTNIRTKPSNIWTLIKYNYCVYYNAVGFVVQCCNALSRELYFVKVDIKKCYDTILQHKLFNIVKDVLQAVGAWSVY